MLLPLPWASTLRSVSIHSSSPAVTRPWAAWRRRAPYLTLPPPWARPQAVSTQMRLKGEAASSARSWFWYLPGVKGRGISGLPALEAARLGGAAPVGVDLASRVPTITGDVVGVGLALDADDAAQRAARVGGGH